MLWFGVFPPEQMHAVVSRIAQPLRTYSYALPATLSGNLGTKEVHSR